MLAAFGGASLRLHFVEPRGLGILGEKRTMYAGEDGHRSILARRSRGAGEGLRDLACQIQHGQITGHSKLLTRRERMEPLKVPGRPSSATLPQLNAPRASLTNLTPSFFRYISPPDRPTQYTCGTPTTGRGAGICRSVGG